MAPLQTDDFASEGVTLDSVLVADFDARAQRILDGKAGPVLTLKPYLAIVSNHNALTVVAYTVKWTATLRNQSSQLHRTQFKFPDAVAGAMYGLPALEGREIRSGEERLVGIGFEAWPPEQADSYRDFGGWRAEQLGPVIHLRIMLDAVIFENGVMLGPDESRLGEHFITFLQAKQAAYREIVTGLETNDPAEDVFAPLRQILAAPLPPETADPLAIYRKQTAGEVLALHNRTALEVFRRTLRREPFAIRRVRP